MAAPEFVICLECDSPTYVFEWHGERVVEAFCEVCGNDDEDAFLSQQDYEDLVESG